MNTSAKGLRKTARTNLSAFRCGKQPNWPTNILKGKLRNKSLMEIAGRLCAGVFFVAVALFSRSTLVIAGGSPFAADVATDQSVAQAVVVPPMPPAGFSPLVASDQDLADYGYPPRPDPQSAPQAYAKWKRLVSVPIGENPQLTQTKIYSGPARSVSSGKTLNSGIVSVTSNNSSGYAAVGPRGTFTPNNSIIYQEWIVPVAEPAHGVCNGIPVYSVQWPGFDGFNSGDVLQGGTEADAICSGSGGSTLYSAWIEWFPFPLTRVSIPPVHPGNFMLGEVWYTTSSPHGHVFLANYTLLVGKSYAFNPPPGTIFVGNSAEWIMERVGFSNGGLANLTNYNGFADAFNVDFASNTLKSFYPGFVPAGSTSYAITMTCPPWNPGSFCTKTTGISFPNLYGLFTLWFYDGAPAF